MNLSDAIASGFSNYVNFSGRATRSEYWYWVLFIALVQIATLIIDLAINARMAAGISDLASVIAAVAAGFYGVAAAIFGLATIIPSFAVTIRRLHDLDRTGWWIFLPLIPIVGGIVLLIWYCSKGTEGPNRFGPDRLAELAAA